MNVKNLTFVSMKQFLMLAFVIFVNVKRTEQHIYSLPHLRVTNDIF